MVTDRSRPRGRFVTIEGIEGAGKSTHAHALADWLRGSGHDVVVTSEPDGTPFGVRVRELLGALEALDPLAECLLFAAARAEHVRRVVRPALERGAVVISDRYMDSTTAYQGYGRGLDLEAVGALNRLATDGLRPDLTVILDLEASEGLRRARSRSARSAALGGDRDADPFERLGLEFHERVRKGYRAIREREPARVVLVDATAAPSAVAAAVRAAVGARLGLAAEARR